MNASASQGIGASLQTNDAPLPYQATNFPVAKPVQEEAKATITMIGDFHENESAKQEAEAAAT